MAPNINGNKRATKVTVNAMLTNDLLKEHCKVEEQQAAIAQLKATAAQQQKQIETLWAGFAEHLTKHGLLFCVDAHRDGKRFIVNLKLSRNGALGFIVFDEK